MTFQELEHKEQERISNAINTNNTITLLITIYFTGLIAFLLFKGGFSLFESIVNLIISFVFIYLSYFFKKKTLSLTITKRVFDIVRIKYNDIVFENALKEISVEQIKGIGYIFTYKDIKLIYTFIDNDIKEYIVNK